VKKADKMMHALSVKLYVHCYDVTCSVMPRTSCLMTVNKYKCYY